MYNVYIEYRGLFMANTTKTATDTVTNGVISDANKWWLSTTLLFTVSFIAYLVYSIAVNLVPEVDIILILVTAYAMGSGYRKLSTVAANGKK